jgi:hypothetical protein
MADSITPSKADGVSRNADLSEDKLAHLLKLTDVILLFAFPE